MFGIYKKNGFTFLELMVVVAILGILTAIIVPNFIRQTSAYKRKEFITRVQTLLRVGWQNALETQKLHRIVFDLKKNQVQLEIESQKGIQEKDRFTSVSIPYLNTIYKWPSHLLLKQLYVDGKEMLQQAGIKTETVWFYIIPEGLVQPVIMNIADSSEQTARGKDVEIGMVINPFTADIKTYDNFAKP